MKEPDWALWANYPHVSLQAAVALSCNIPPELTTQHPRCVLMGMVPKFEEFDTARIVSCPKVERGEALPPGRTEDLCR
jgi:hypothetical protein